MAKRSHALVGTLSHPFVARCYQTITDVGGSASAKISQSLPALVATARPSLDQRAGQRAV